MSGGCFFYHNSQLNVRLLFNYDVELASSFWLDAVAIIFDEYQQVNAKTGLTSWRTEPRLQVGVGIQPICRRFRVFQICHLYQIIPRGMRQASPHNFSFEKLHAHFL